MSIAIVPRPATLTVHDGRYELGPDTTVRAPQPLAELVRELLGPATGYRFPDGAGDGGAGHGRGIVLAEAADPELGGEGYRLVVDAAGVRAEGSLAGLRWAVQTLRQLLPVEIFAGSVVAGARWQLPYLEVVDVPRYGWRGSLLDVARWYQPVSFLFRYVDLMALHKLNRLHLHLTDDQGWRFEVLGHPRLTEVGGYRTESSAGHARAAQFDGTPHGGFYRQRELRDLVDYAARRGVQIMPEIDAPGHMQAAISAYPWLGNEPDRQLPVRTSWGISAHVLNTAQRTVSLITDVLDEVVSVFPFEYVHVGGDEVPPDEWAASPAAQRTAREAGLARVDDLVGWWATRLAGHLAGHGRRVAVWDELLDRGAPPGALIFGWRDASRVSAARAAGFDVVAVPQEYTYLDWAESDGPAEPLAIRGTLPLAKVYGYRPGTVAGVQGQLWSEYLPTAELVEWRAYPRLAALAEVGWSGPDGAGYGEFRTRLAGHLGRLDLLRVHYRPLD